MAQTRRRTLSTLIAVTAVAVGIVHPAQAHAARAAQAEARAAGGSGVNGLLVALWFSGGLGGVGEILEVCRGRVLRVLVRGLPFPAMNGLAASPRGRYVAFSEAATIAPGHPPRTQGLWLVPATGGSPRRLLLPPRSVEGNQLGIGPVAWSPDGSTLAYAVNPAGGTMNVSRPEPALGIWLTRYDHVHPCLLVTLAQLGAVDAPPSRAPFVVNQVSWSSDGRTLAVSTFRPMPGATQPGQTTPVMLAVTTTTGAVRPLVRGGRDGSLRQRAPPSPTSRAGPVGRRCGSEACSGPCTGACSSVGCFPARPGRPMDGPSPTSTAARACARSSWRPARRGWC